MPSRCLKRSANDLGLNVVVLTVVAGVFCVRNLNRLSLVGLVVVVVDAAL